MHAGAGKAGASVLDGEAPPLGALAGAVSTAADRERAAAVGTLAQRVENENGKTMLSEAPLIVVSAKDFLGVNAGQSLQLANGETTSLMSAQDVHLAGGAGLRVQTGQAIGALGSALNAGNGGIGLQVIAANNPISVQAQSATLAVQARDGLSVVSANAQVDWAAAQRIVLSTAGGASVTIDAGNIGVHCPGKLTVHAGKKSLTDPQELGYPMPALPRSICVECLKRALPAGAAFSMVE
jgi:uncharacterized protein (DUF2345 family)